MGTPPFISTTYDMREYQVERMRWIYRVVQSPQAIGDEHSAVVILAGKGCHSHGDTVDIRCHLSQKGRVIASAEIVEDFGLCNICQDKWYAFVVCIKCWLRMRL